MPMVMASPTTGSVSIPRRVRRRFPQHLGFLPGCLPSSLSQSPEGSAGDFHAVLAAQSGAANTMSQSPEGSAGDFHIGQEQLSNRPIGHRQVSIPRRVRRRFPQQLHLDTVQEKEFIVSIPRRVRRRFPPCRNSGEHRRQHHPVSIPRRVRRRFPQPASFREMLAAGCLNPPKGPPAISTARRESKKRTGEKDVSIPRRVRRRFPLRTITRSPKGDTEMSQSPEGSAGDFHLPAPYRYVDQSPSLNPPKGPPAISTNLYVIMELVRTL